jgi:hypothetical protein
MAMTHSKDRITSITKSKGKRIQKSSLKNDQRPQRGFKQTAQ